jgi:hypothetical protein
MLRKLSKIFVSIAVCLALSHGALAEERYALLIGNKDYTQRIGKLKNPINDVRFIKEALIRVGFKEGNIEVITNANQSTITRAAKALGYKLRAAGPDAVGFFYYSGHGAAGKIIDSGQTANYIIPVDVEETKGVVEMLASSVPLGDIIKILRESSRVSDLIIVFDACRNELRMNIRAIGSKIFVAEPSVPISSLLGFSTDVSSYASDAGEDGGPFAKALAQELVRTDQHHEQVFFNAQQAVIQATHNQQKPYYINRIEKRLYFIESSGSVNPQESSSWKDTLRTNSPEAFREFIQRYPGSSYAREAMRRMLARQEEIEWNLASSSGQREDLTDYLSRYPNGRFSDIALDQLEAIGRAEEQRDWRSAKSSNSEAKILAFLDRYPNTTRYDEARDIIIGLRQSANKTPLESEERSAWEEAQRLDSIPAYSKYLTLFEAHAQQARLRLAELSELRDWQEARDSKLVGRLQKFLMEHPNGPHAEDARELISTLIGPQQVIEFAQSPVLVQTKGISEDLFKEKKRVERQNLFFPEGKFGSFVNGKIAQRLNFGKAQPIRRLLLTNSLTTLYSGGDDGTVRIWDLNGAENNRILSPVHGKRIYALASSDNSRYLATGSWDRRVFLWNSHTNRIFGEVAVRPQIYTMAFSPTGRWIAAAGSEGQVDFIRVRDQKVVNRRYVSPARTIFSLAYLPNRSEDLVLGDASGALRLWSVVKGRERYAPDAHGNKILALTVSPDGSRIASAGMDRSVKLWTNTLTRVAEIKQAHPRYVTSLRFTPDGRYLATGGADALVRMWDVKTSKPVRGPFVGHSGDVETIEFSPDGKYMFTSSEDKTVRIWDVDEAKLLYTLVAFTDGGYVIFDPQQRYLASDDIRSILKGR